MPNVEADAELVEVIARLLNEIGTSEELYARIVAMKGCEDALASVAMILGVGEPGEKPSPVRVVEAARAVDALIVEHLFVLVCHDRHCDDRITLHRTQESADQAIDQWKRDYPEIDTWNERDCGRPQGWTRYVDTYDDGPRCRVEKRSISP